MVKFQEGGDRENGWMEIQLGEFYVDLEENSEVQVQLLDTSGNRTSGLVVEESSSDHSSPQDRNHVTVAIVNKLIDFIIMYLCIFSHSTSPLYFRGS